MLIITCKASKVTNAHEIGLTHKHSQPKKEYQQWFEIYAKLEVDTQDHWSSLMFGDCNK
jgi:hypothetical protein